ncbi:MAG: aldehyde dehydrogenase family protein [Halobacteriovoraceae bacterium]|nr:aldehyde dehydrogenase family protein [Halobacteriovoraceae bacterium]
MKIINPANHEIISEVKEDTLESVKKKYEILQTGQKAWANHPIGARLEIIKRFSKLLDEHADELAEELCREVGKPINEARGEINGAIVKIEFFLNESAEILKPSIVHKASNTQEVIDYSPLGTIANISAWNYPYLVGINIFIPALICGNAVLYKPSEFSTLVGQSIERLLHRAGVPKNVFLAVYGDGKVGRMLCDLPLDGYFFTGSYETGKKIAETVAHKLVPVGLELGGKDPLYVTDQLSDIKQTAESVVEGAFYNNGQSCCSVERVYVHEKIYDEFVDYFVEVVKKLKVGNPLDSTTQMGAITRASHLDFLDQLIKDAVSKGAKIVAGGNRIDSEGNYYEPTVLLDVNHKMDVMIKETFGPIIGIQKVKDDEEAIRLMNDSEYGLTSSVYTSNNERGNKILSQINSGTGYLNCCDRVSGYLPWSGRGHSGLGSTLSKHGVYAFCHPKAYHLR